MNIAYTLKKAKNINCPKNFQFERLKQDKQLKIFFFVNFVSSKCRQDSRIHGQGR